MKRAFSRKNIWDKLPSAFKKGIGKGLAIVPLQYLLGTRFRRKLEFVRRAQYWSAEQSREYQLSQLRRICNIARRTEYYGKAFSDAGFNPSDLKCIEDFARLALIDKTTVNEHLNEMMTFSRQSRDIDYVSTGGTSGMPLHFYMSADRSAVEYAYLVASWNRADFKLGDTLAVFRGRVVEPDKDGLRHEYDPLLRHHYYSNFHMSDEMMRDYLKHVSTLGRCFLHVYPSSAAALARYLRRTKQPHPQNICGIIAESEIVYPDQRKMVEETFGCRYFSCYGHTEKLILASECEHSTDYHIWPTYGYFELLDEKGQPVNTPGQQGEIVGTGFINSVVPFIRYRTGDFATYIANKCNACGREHILIRDIQGHRTQEMLIAHDNSQISWTAMNMHDDTFNRVRQFQFYQDTPGKAVLKIIPADGFGDQDIGRIQKNLSQKLQDQIQFTIELTETIPLSPRGKIIYVDQQIYLRSF